MGYDPALRLYQVAGAATTRFLYDGADAIAEYDGASALQRRFVFDPTTGQPVLWYEGTGTAAANRRYLSADERGSVISVSGSTGASLGLNSYDEYGKPGAANLGRYQYTGQKWIGEANVYDYKARDYVPQLGIFAQTDPIGFGGGMNIYAYTAGDPVNFVDPSGMATTIQSTCTTIPGIGGGTGPDIVIQPSYSYCTYYLISDPQRYYDLGLGGGDGGGAQSTGTRLLCSGKAYVLAGNPSNVGHEGFPGVTVTNQSAAVIPRQWTGSFAGGPVMRAIGQSTFGWVFGKNGKIEFFSGLTQSIGFARLGSALYVQNMIMARAPDELVLEIVGGEDLGKDASVVLNAPDQGQGCPVGTR